MAEFPNQYQRMAPDSLTASPQAPTVMQPQVQIQQPIPPPQVQQPIPPQQVQLQQPIPLQQVQTTGVEPRHRYKNTLYGLGISEVVFGSISVILGIVTLITAPHDFYSDLSHGIWCGLFLIATGILGIKAKSNPSVCMYNANMAMSIITANAMVILMVLSGMAAALYSRYAHIYRLQILVTLHSILVIVGFAAAVVCIVHSAYCCAGVCCRRTPYSGPVTYTPQPYGVQQPQQIVRLANGQHMLVTAQPGVPQGYTVMPNPMIASQMMYQPPQGGAIMPQTTMTGQPRFIHPTAAYLPVGSQQPVQVSTVTNAPPQGLAGVHYPTSTTQMTLDVDRKQALAAEASPGYSP